jgi:hypothetical protein
MTKKEICSKIVESIKDYLSTPSRLDAFKAKNRFVRNRLLSIIHVIMYLLYTNRSSMATNLANIKRELCEITTFPKRITKQAVSHARQGICPLLFSELFNMSVDIFYKNIPERKDWHGLHVFAIDGSKFELPNSKDLFDHFGKMFSVHDHDKMYTQALASVVYDVLDDYIVHASINRYLASERDAAVKHLENLEALGIYDNSVVVFDRGYYSEKMFRYCVSHGHYCVMRLKGSVNFAKSAGKKNADIITAFEGNSKEGTEDIKVRIISVKLESGEYEYLATNIFDKSFTIQMFRQLYFLRWPVELKYLELKERLQIEDFNGATTTSIIQEFYIGLLLSNLSALIKGSADEEIKASSNPANKHRYQSNRSFIIGQMKMLLPKMVFGIVPISSCIDNIYNDACKEKSQIQPGRKFKRKIRKDNKRTHFRNRKPAF